MKVRELVQLLKKQGWVEMGSRASHRHFRHPVRAQVVTLPGDQVRDLAPETRNDILRKAGLK
jgi:predicted RNA binding protein YcfA (HicA-like mRNA interferase family)